MLSYILALFTGLLVLFFDQYTKELVIANFKLAESHEFIDGLINFVYIHNKGGAWGLLSGRTWILLSITIVIMFVCVVLLIKYGLKNKLMFWAVSLILFGGIGNMIDRIFRDGNVIDFIHLDFMPDFPVFNIADCAIVIGAGLLILYFVLDIIKDNRQKKKLAKSIGQQDDNN